MKKTLALALTVLLALLAFCAAAQEQTLPSVGDALCGFRVKEIAHNGQYDLDLVLMEHERTGAQLIYIPCEDTERSFTVSFRTPAENDKGIPHVYEHSTLGGSEKYPDPSLFFSMINQTYNTHLNAATYISNTTFDSASLSEEQLLAFADYTLDGLYHPTIMTDERTMMREAYRYELTDEDAPLTLTGTVYSEMKAHTSPLTLSQTRAMKLLYPGSRFAAFNGGDPDHIPEMTWDELRAFHDTYYHPSNSMTILYGKLDPEPFLALIDGAISAYDRREITLTDEGYTPISGQVEETVDIPVSADSPVEAYVYYGIPLTDLSEHETDVLSQYGGMYVVEGSPLFELFATQMPYATLSVNLVTSAPVPALLFSVYGTLPEDAEQVKALLKEGLALTAEQGLDASKMEAAAASFKLSMLDAREQNNRGINLGQLIAFQWGVTGDPLASQTDDRRIMQVTELADAGCLQALTQRALVAPQTSAFGVYVTVPGALEEKNAAEEARLVQMKADMTDEERAALIARTQDFAAWTEENAAHSMIDAVKVVSAQDLPEELVRYEAQESTQDGVRVIRADVDSNELLYVSLVFRADCIPYEQYDAFDAYINTLGSFATENYTSDTLQTAMMAISDGMSLSRDTLTTAEGGFVPVVTLSWTCLPENVGACFELARELLLRADVTDVERARLSMLTNNQTTQLYLSMMPEMVIDAVLPGYANDALRFEALSCMGDRFTTSMRMGEQSDEELGALLADCQQLLLDVMRRENLTVCTVGSAQNNNAAIAEGLRFASGLSDEPGTHIDYAALMEPMPESIAFPMDIDVGYNGIALSYEGSGYERTGKLLAFGSLVTNKVLMPELRFKRSCYGAFMQIGYTGALIYSYRDPGLADTFALYESLGDIVRGLELTQDDIDGFIVSTFSSLSMPSGPMTGGKQAISDRLNARDTFSEKLECMHDVKQFTPQDVAELAGLLDLMVSQGGKVSIQAASLVEQSSELFEVIDPCFQFSDGLYEDMMPEEYTEETQDAA